MNLKYFSFMLLLILSSCVSSGFREFYAGNRLTKSNESFQEIKKKYPKPILYTSTNMYNDSENMFENGFIMLGSSSFNGANIDYDDAIYQAWHIGASHVLVQTNFTHSVSGNYTYADNNFLVSTPYSVNRYDCLATYWVKSNQKFRLGVYVKDLTSEMKEKLRRNRGVVTTIIVKGTPAYKNDIVKGDLIIKINEFEINDTQDFEDTISNKTIKNSSLKIVILRDNKTIFKLVNVDQ